MVKDIVFIFLQTISLCLKCEFQSFHEQRRLKKNLDLKPELDSNLESTQQFLDLCAYTYIISKQ